MDGEDLDFLAPGDLGGGRDWELVRLPRAARLVRVRYVATHETTRLSVLPDMVEFSRVALRVQLAQAAIRKGEKPPPGPDIDPGEYAADQLRWQARLAHLAVMPGTEIGEDVPCDGCGFAHPAALLSVAQASRLHQDDLSVVTDAALRGRALGAVRPFSEDPTPEGSPGPADTSESIPSPS